MLYKLKIVSLNGIALFQNNRGTPEKIFRKADGKTGMSVASMELGG